jgi:colicin import membrane protein
VTAFNGYPFSVFLAVLLHGLIIGTLLMIQRVSFEPAELIRPPSVQAQLVAENPQARNEQRQAQQQAEQRQQEQARQQEAERQAEQRRQEEAARQEAQRQAEAEAQRQADAEAERQRQAQLQREREAQQERERQQQLEQERLEQQRRQEEARQEALRQQQAEEAARQAEAQAAAQSAAQDQVAGYTAIIHDLVQRNWSRPPSARNGMTAVLRIRMVPTGDVVDVEIVRSSGDAAFDRAAEDAVRAVGRFRELSSMPPRLFEANFRSLLLTFRPEDLLN